MRRRATNRPPLDAASLVTQEEKIEPTPEEPKPAPRVSFFTLGCRLNQHDTAAMRSDLERGGWRAGEPERADVLIVNTCTVTRRADQEARQLVRRLAAARPGAAIVVTGCYAERAPGEVAGLPGVRAVVGTAERERIAEALEPWRASAVARGATRAAATRAWPDLPSGTRPPIRARRDFAASAPLSFGRTRALLKVQDGCDSFCAYCVVPMVRGRSRSLPLAGALEQARRLLDAGFHELVVTGADLGSYGWDLGEGSLLPELVERILSLGGAHRVRLSSIEPHKLDPALVAMIGVEPRLCRHLHLPLQSGSDRVLGIMRRGYRASDYRSLVDRIAARGPVAIGADVIVGHPGEDAAEFRESLRFVEESPITHLHVFRYSPRPGTAAERLDGFVDSAGPRERAAAMRALGDRKREAFLRSLVGSTLPGIPEAPRGSSRVPAMTDLYATVRLSAPPPRRGIVPVLVTACEAGELVGTAAG